MATQPDAPSPEPTALTAHPHSPPAPRSPRPHPDSEDDDDFDDTYGPVVADKQGSAAGEALSKPFFFPPLWLARRTACAQLLQSEDVKSVVDYGCGAGAVLSLLALPAYHRDEFPLPASPPSSSEHAPSPAYTKADKLALLASLPPPSPSSRGLHLSRLIGIDADPSACEKAAKVCAPPAEGEAREPRWEEMRTEVWRGGVEVYNEALEGVDAFVMTEVIEHLTPSALSRIPSLLFSVYKPRLVIITTPNHAFNAYFPPPSPSSSPSRPSWSRNTPQNDEEHPLHLFPDPTKRTTRVFRDATHTLEWTPEEFRSWCADALRDAGAEDAYDVEFTGVGSLEAYYRPCGGEVPFPPPALALHPALADHPLCTARPEDPRAFFATQIAVFRRRAASGYGGKDEQRAAREEQDAEDEERASRSPRVSPINTYAPLPPAVSPLAGSAPFPSRGAGALDVPRVPHTLVASDLHSAHPTVAGPPASGEQLREAVRGVFRRARRGACVSVEEVWRAGWESSAEEGAGEGEGAGLRALARGEVRAVVDALLGDDDAEGEWAFERLEAEEGRRELRGWEALGVRWARYEEEVGALEREEAEEERRWREEREREEEGDAEGSGEERWAELEQEQEPEQPADTEAQGDEPEATTQLSLGWGTAPAQQPQKADEEETRASWTVRGGADGQANGGWGDDPW
ncbi:hypothetical protein JCM10449v2_007955 [Rhodotorula kratochvilovae]